MPNLPTGTVTFLFTDLEGSTQLWERHPGAMRAALARHDQLLRQAVERHHGHVFKTVGDAFCVAFQDPPEALAAALDGQFALVGEDWGELGPLRSRMALHTGSAEERDGDYFGPTLNRAARLLAIGHGGQSSGAGRPRPPAQNLFEAVKGGRPDEVKAFLARGEPVDARDPKGWTPLIWAAFKGYGDAVMLLLTNGADVDGQTHDGETALTRLEAEVRMSRRAPPDGEEERLPRARIFDAVDSS